MIRAQARCSKMENDKCKILWDFTVQTDHEIYGRRPDVIVVQKDENHCQIIHFACPYERIVDTKELVICALGTTPISLRNWLKETGIETQITELQQTVLLYTAQILQNVLEV